MSSESVVDHGQKHVRLVYAINTDGMREGEKRQMHIKADHLAQAAGIKHIDLLNPQEIAVHIESTAGKLGLSLFHDENADVRLNTASRAALVNSKTGSVDAYHAISSSSGVSDVHTLHMEPGVEQTAEHAPTLHKRINNVWGNMTAANVAVGVHASTLGDETRYLITEGDENGRKSAIHQLLVQNQNNSRLLNGRYTAANIKKSVINGKNAIVMTEADFNTVKDSLTDSLSTKSLFQHGLNAVVTKLDERPTARHPSYVHVKISRSPMNSDTGVTPMASSRVTENHVAMLTGTHKGSKITAATIAAPGFEDVLAKGSNVHTAAKVVPFTPEEVNGELKQATTESHLHRMHDGSDLMATNYDMSSSDEEDDNNDDE